jgi:tetratricopeptide (TPR) repeat protein
MLYALNTAASSIRTKLGESLSMLQKFATPVEQATTPSLDALHAFSLGVKTKDINGDEAAIPLFQEAIKLDPGFAMAYALLGTSYSNLEERSRGAEMLKKAYDLRERVSEHEKFYIEAYYWDLVLGDLTKAMQQYQHWAQVYPRDDRPVGNLGLLYGYLGQHEKAVIQAREALRLQSESGLRYANLVQGYVHVGRLPEAQSTVEEARKRNLESPYLDLYAYQLAFVQDDAAKMAEEVGRAAGKPGVEDMLLAAEADTAAYYGQLPAARDFSRQAIASTNRAAEKETAASYEAAAALREALFGNPGMARQHAEAALAISKGRDVQYASALALSFTGAGQRAQQLSEELSMDFPQDTLVQSVYLPTIRGEIAVSRRDWANAIELLKIASQYELGMPGDAEFSPSLYPVYVRGNAYLAAGQGVEAAAEFEKILKWPGVVLNEPIAALAHLGLARAYALQGNTAKARSAYQDFLTLWKNADPDVPVLKLAKAEYAKL